MGVFEADLKDDGLDTIAAAEVFGLGAARLIKDHVLRANLMCEQGLRLFTLCTASGTMEVSKSLCAPCNKIFPHT